MDSSFVFRYSWAQAPAERQHSVTNEEIWTAFKHGAANYNASDQVVRPHLVYRSDGSISDTAGEVVGSIRRERLVHQPLLARLGFTTTASRTVVRDAQQRLVMSMSCDLRQGEGGVTGVNAVFFDPQGKLLGRIDEEPWSFAVANMAKPEEARWSLRRAARELADWWSIKEEHLIVKGPAGPVAEILRTEPLGSEFVVRDPTAGLIGRIDAWRDGAVTLTVESKAGRELQPLLLAAVPTLVMRFHKWPPAWPRHWLPPIFDAPVSGGDLW